MGCGGVLGAAAENDLLPEVYNSLLIKHSACLRLSAPSLGKPHKQQPFYLTKHQAAHLTRGLCRTNREERFLQSERHPSLPVGSQLSGLAPGGKHLLSAEVRNPPW